MVNSYVSKEELRVALTEVKGYLQTKSVRRAVNFLYKELEL